MFASRVSFVGAIACLLALPQSAYVTAAPQMNLRPYLHVYGVEGSGVSSAIIPSSTAVTESSVVAAVEPAATSAAPETPAEDAAQTSGAFANAAGLSVALFVGSVTAAIQLI